MINAKLTITIALIFAANSSWAQGPYIKLISGYAFGTGQEYISSYDFSNEDPPSYKNESLSLGKGLSYGATAGLMLTSNAGLELGVSMLNGAEESSIDNIFGDESELAFRAKSTNISLSFLYQGNGKIFKPYGKIGLVAASTTLTTNTVYTSPQPSTTEMEQEISGGLQIGFASGVGVSYPVNHKVSLFGEGVLTIISFQPTKGEVTAYSINGEDVLASLETYERETEYKKSLEFNDEDIDPNKPEQAIRDNWAMSSIGFNFGLKFNL